MSPGLAQKIHPPRHRNTEKAATPKFHRSTLQLRAAQHTMLTPPSPVPSTSDTSRLRPTFSRVLLLLALSIFINYADRANLSIAAPLLKGELGISDSQLGILLSAFFWTYSCCQLLAGWLVDGFDVKWMFAAGFFLWSSATALTGLMHSLTILLIMRIVLGMEKRLPFLRIRRFSRCSAPRSAVASRTL